MPSASLVADSPLDLISATPVVRLNRVEPDGHGEVWAKLESFNPGERYLTTDLFRAEGI